MRISLICSFVKSGILYLVGVLRYCYPLRRRDVAIYPASYCYTAELSSTAERFWVRNLVQNRD